MIKKFLVLVLVLSLAGCVTEKKIDFASYKNGTIQTKTEDKDIQSYVYIIDYIKVTSFFQKEKVRCLEILYREVQLGDYWYNDGIKVRIVVKFSAYNSYGTQITGIHTIAVGGRHDGFGMSYFWQPEITDYLVSVEKVNKWIDNYWMKVQSN